MVLLSDVDFLVDFGLSDPVRYEAMQRATRHHGAIVLPAFEPADALGIEKGREMALRTAELDGRPTNVYVCFRKCLTFAVLQMV